LLRYIAAILYVVAPILFLVCMIVTGLHYGPPTYNPITDTISDLQAVHCGTFQGTYVCSPLHSLANFSVAMLGLSIAVGSLSILGDLSKGRRGKVAVGLLIATGLAALANALTPEDVTLIGDTITAIIVFLAANFGLIQIGRTMHATARNRIFGLFGQILGTIGIVAFILDGFGIGTVIGMGAIEWLIVAPILGWAPTMGLHSIIQMQQPKRVESEQRQ